MLITILLITTAGILGAGVWLWTYLRRPRADQFLRFRCPGCGQKLRILASKAGKDCKCPQCWQVLSLSDDPAASSIPSYSPAGYQLRVAPKRVPTA